MRCRRYFKRITFPHVARGILKEIDKRNKRKECKVSCKSIKATAKNQHNDYNIDSDVDITFSWNYE